MDLANLQDTEVGDGTTSVVILAAELLKNAGELVKHKVCVCGLADGLAVIFVIVQARKKPQACTLAGPVVRDSLMTLKEVQREAPDLRACGANDGRIETVCS